MMTPTDSNPSSTGGISLFRTAGGKNHLFTFVLICSLFLLWGCCSGLLDNLNKHFQNTLQLSKFQSGFVQWAFYMGYCLVALPAGMVSRRFGYKGGIIVWSRFGRCWERSGSFQHLTLTLTGRFCWACSFSPAAWGVWKPTPIPTRPSWDRRRAERRALTWRKRATDLAGYPECLLAPASSCPQHRK